MQRFLDGGIKSGVGTRSKHELLAAVIAYSPTRLWLTRVETKNAAGASLFYSAYTRDKPAASPSW